MLLNNESLKKTYILEHLFFQLSQFLRMNFNLKSRLYTMQYAPSIISTLVNIFYINFYIYMNDLLLLLLNYSMLILSPAHTHTHYLQFLFYKRKYERRLMYVYWKPWEK